jgi:hypothetical protein
LNYWLDIYARLPLSLIGASILKLDLSAVQY